MAIPYIFCKDIVRHTKYGYFFLNNVDRTAQPKIGLDRFVKGNQVQSLIHLAELVVDSLNRNGRKIFCRKLFKHVTLPIGRIGSAARS